MLTVDSFVSETTHLLRAWAAGGERAMDDLLPRKLRRLTRCCLQKERPEQTLQLPDLVRETCLRPADLSRVDWRRRNRFFAVPATLMQGIRVAGARMVGPRFFVALGVEETAA